MSNIKETAAALGEKAQDLGRTASAKMDQVRSDTADALHTAASAVRSTGSQAASSINQCAADTGKILDSTSSYVRKHDAASMLRDLGTVVRRHPGKFIVLTASIAACIGYLAASRTNERAEPDFIS